MCGRHGSLEGTSCHCFNVASNASPFAHITDIHVDAHHPSNSHILHEQNIVTKELVIYTAVQKKLLLFMTIMIIKSMRPGLS